MKTDAEKVKIAEEIVDVLTMKKEGVEKVLVVDVVDETMVFVDPDEVEPPKIYLGPVSVIREWFEGELPMAIAPDPIGQTDKVLIQVYDLILKEANDIFQNVMGAM